MMKSLLIPLTYFCLQTWLETPQANLQVELSLMPDAFDDQYIGCAEEMDGIAPELLKEEKSVPSVFSRVWENSEKKWELVKKKISLPTGFKDENGRAIIAYTDDDFHRVAKKFGTDTLFIIHTCFGVEIRAFSRSQEEEEVLIPVHEIFSTSRGQRSNRFVLRSTNQTCSHFNCAYLGGEYWAEQEKYLCGVICCGEFETPTSGRAEERDADLGTCLQGWGRQAATMLASREASSWGEVDTGSQALTEEREGA
ncbi:ecto-ADP-ribosyltransferase 5-like isoform 5-T5 [Macrochelys suwanniensis]